MTYFRIDGFGTIYFDKNFLVSIYIWAPCIIIFVLDFIIFSKRSFHQYCHFSHFFWNYKIYNKWWNGSYVYTHQSHKGLKVKISRINKLSPQSTYSSFFSSIIFKHLPLFYRRIFSAMVFILKPPQLLLKTLSVQPFPHLPFWLQKWASIVPAVPIHQEPF